MQFVYKKHAISRGPLMRNHGIRDLIYPRTPLKAQSEFGAPPLNPSQNNEKYGRFAKGYIF